MYCVILIWPHDHYLNCLSFLGTILYDFKHNFGISFEKLVILCNSFLMDYLEKRIETKYTKFCNGLLDHEIYYIHFSISSNKNLNQLDICPSSHIFTARLAGNITNAT